MGTSSRFLKRFKFVVLCESIARVSRASQRSGAVVARGDARAAATQPRRGSRMSRRASGVSTGVGVAGAAQRARAQRRDPRAGARGGGAELGYRADRTASLLARRRGHLLGVMLDVRNPFHAELVEELHEAADAGRLRPGAQHAHPDPRRGSERSRRCSTSAARRCILLGPEAPTARLAALARQLPVVVGRAAHLRGRRGRGAHRRRRGRRPGRRPSGRSRPPRHRLRRRRAGRRSPPTGGADTARPCAAPAWPTASVSSPATTPRRAASGPAADARSAGRPPTAVVAFNDRCAVGLLDAFARARRRRPGRRLAWSATTTAHPRSWRTST